MSAGVQPVDWLAIGPVLGPAVAALLVLAVDAVVGARRTRLVDALAVGGLLVGLALLVPQGSDATFCSVPGRCSYVVSSLTLSLQAVVLAAALVCLLLAVGLRDRLPRTELHLLVLTATAGACALAAARDYATLAVALETASLPLVALVALRRDGRGAEAGLKLLMTSVVSFGLLALGIALVYASTGSLYLGQPVATALGDLRAAHGVGLALVVAGAAFKLSLVPFHLWTPDTYAGAPLPVAAFLSTVSKVAGLSAVVLVLAVGAPERAGDWAAPVGVLAAVTMTVGNLVALRQRTAVRLLAWSTVAQAGWVVLPLAGAVSASRVTSAVSASLGYLLAYVVATLAAFAVVVRVAEAHPDGARHPLSAYAGLWRRRPALALVLGFALLCLAGLPPGVMGVVAKIVAIAPVVGVGAYGLVTVAVVNVVLGVAVYLRWAGALVSPGEEAAASGTTPVAHRLALALGAGGCVALSVLPQLVAGVLARVPLR
ncbi:MAG: proton-conducting transporter membrane subunit [Actinomycetota bacterium]